MANLLLLAHGDKVLGHVAHVHHAGCVLEHFVLLVMGKSENIEGFVSELRTFRIKKKIFFIKLWKNLHVFLVIDGLHSSLALRHIPVVEDVVTQKALLLEIGDSVRPRKVKIMSNSSIYFRHIML